MNIQWTSVVISFATGALTGALVAYFRHWLARRREAESHTFAEAQDRDRIGRGHHERALGHHRSRESLRGCDLAEQGLAGIYLEKADLRRANLSDADLSHSNLEDANLIGADLTRANIAGASRAKVIYPPLAQRAAKATERNPSSNERPEPRIQH